MDTSNPMDNLDRIHQVLYDVRSINLQGSTSAQTPKNLLHAITIILPELEKHGYTREADSLRDTVTHCALIPDFGGLGLSENQLDLQANQEREILFLLSAYLEALNYQDRHATPPPEPLLSRPPGRRGMTLAEKIFAAHDVRRKGAVRAGEVIRVDVDWVIASELSWSGMEKTYNDLGRPGIFRNDRVWIAGDHVVDPRVRQSPKIKALVDASERARRVFKLTEYQGMNYTIMHTEFCRERAQPGMLVIGSDSHTCSAGSVSCLAVGLGVADVTMPLVTGETWFRVPETVEIRFINKPRPGLGGKDVILYILKELKRNTVAAERVVEYTGPGSRHLSCDARFAISNMTTEFGGVTGIFVPDERTQEFIARRKNPKYKRQANYYKPDPDARYAESHTIDLANVESFIARYPNPDDVVPASVVADTALDGCFIGACTTAREDLILAALVLEAGLKRGMVPVKHGKRKVVPGSLPILHDLRARGLAGIYERAGFEVGVPGCSYCVGMSADKAGPGEVWLSSQNRNFENRMGPGALGSIASAVTVAASSFRMKITDPTSLLDGIDLERLEEMLGTPESPTTSPVQYVEPAQVGSAESPETEQECVKNRPGTSPVSSPSQRYIRGKAQVLGDFIDTDALAPSEALTGNLTREEMGCYCLYHTHPDFRQKVQDGLDIVVAGKAFGVGSSRENAVTALQGAGVQCVIARSFAFIYARNQPSLGLLGFVMEDDEFYDLVADGEDLEVDLARDVVRVNNRDFPFRLSRLERTLWETGGIAPAFAKWGKDVLSVVTGGSIKHGGTGQDRSLNW